MTKMNQNEPKYTKIHQNASTCSKMSQNVLEYMKIIENMQHQTSWNQIVACLNHFGTTTIEMCVISMLSIHFEP